MLSLAVAGFISWDVLAADQTGAQQAASAARKHDQAVLVFHEIPGADGRLVVELVPATSHQAKQVSVPLLVLGQDGQVVLALSGSFAIGDFAHVQLASEDRLHTRLLGSLFELDVAADVPMFRECKGLHLQFRCTVDV